MRQLLHCSQSPLPSPYWKQKVSPSLSVRVFLLLVTLQSCFSTAQPSDKCCTFKSLVWSQRGFCCAGVNQLRKAAPKHTKLHKGITCAFVGLLLLSVFNLLLVVVLGTDHNVGRSSHQQGQQTASQATGAQAYDAKSAGYGTDGANPATLV